MADRLNNFACSNGFTDAGTVLFQTPTKKVTFIVTNAAVEVSYLRAPGTGRATGMDWGPPEFVIPASYSLVRGEHHGVGGMRFRNAAAGVVGRVTVISA